MCLVMITLHCKKKTDISVYPVWWGLIRIEWDIQLHFTYIVFKQLKFSLRTLQSLNPV